MFDIIPQYNKYRTLSLQDPLLLGEDVYALQMALNTCYFPNGIPDGKLGVATAQSIRDAQRHFDLVNDGLAGGITQKTLALALVSRIATNKHVPFDALRGQLEHESGFRLGIYSEPRPDGHYDAGVAQRNTKYTLPKEAFNPHGSIRALGVNTRQYFDLFLGVPTLRRRWALAQSSWNAPAFACFLARAEGATRVTKAMTATPSTSARETFEAYISKVSKYLVM